MLQAILLFFLCLITFCCSSGYDCFRSKGEKLSISLAKDLEKITTAQDLKKISPVVKKKIYKLTQLMMDCDRKGIKVGFTQDFSDQGHIASDRLLYEIARLSRDSECSKLIKEIQRDSLEKLDEYEKSKKKSNY